MNTLKNKVLSVSLLAATSLWAVMPVASAQTVDQLQAQIAALLAQIQALQSQVAGGSASTSSATSCTFTRDLTVGMKGDDVKCLQGYLKVSPQSGYFGPLTKAAVKKWQSENGLPSTGYFGPMSRAKYSALVAVVTPTTPTTPTTSTTPSTSSTPSTTTSAPSEGILIVEKNPTPAAGQQLYEGQTADWVGVRFRAQDSDITVGSFKIVYPQSNNSAPARVVSKFEVVDESGNVLKTIDPSAFTQDYSTLDYYYYVTGLNYVVPKGGQKALIVRATAVPTFPSGPNTTLNLIVKDVRGRDTAGIDRFPSDTVSNTVSRQTSVASSARFEVSKNSGSPVENNVVADYATGRVDKVALLKVDFTAKNDRVQLTQLSGSSTASGVTVGTVYLMDGSNVLDSATVDSNHSYTFTNLLSQNIWVEKDTTKTLTIAADVTGATTTDATVSSTVTSVSRKNSLGDTGSDTASVSGDSLHVLTEAPTFAKGSTFNVAVTRDQNNVTTTANATLEVMVTAKGGNVKISSSTPFALLWETNTGSSTSSAKAASEVRDSSNNLISLTSGYYVIPVNQTYKFVIQDQKTFAGAPRVRAKVDSITWQNSANTDVTSSWTDRDLVTDWSN